MQHYLRDEAVTACPPSAGYRFRKFARRHRGAVAATAAVLAALLVGLAVSLGLYWRAETLRRQADQARTSEAEKSGQLQQAVADLEIEKGKVQYTLHHLQVEQKNTRAALNSEQRSAYFNRVALAHNEWQINNVPRADRLLDACPADLRQWEWNYLKRLANSEQCSVRGFKDMVRDAVFSPDGKHLATTDMDGKVKVWDARTAQELLTFRGHTQIPGCVSFSPDGTRIVSASARPEIGGRRGHGFQDFIRMMAMATAAGGGEVLVWEALTGKVLLRFGSEHRGVRSAAFSPDGTRIATSGDDKSIRLWNAETGEQLWCAADAAPAGRLAFSPDGRHLAVGRHDGEGPGEVTIRATDDGAVVSALEGHAGRPVSVSYSPDGKWLASASAGEVVVWNAGQGSEQFRLRVDTGMFGNVAAFSADSRRLAVACMEQKIRIWDVESGDEQQPLRGHTDWVTSVAYSPAGGLLAGTAGNFLPSWFAGDENAGEVKVWDVTHAQDARTLVGHSAAVNAVAYGPPGGVLASAGEDNTVRVWHAADGSLLHTLKGHGGPVNCVAISPRGRWIASGSDDKTVRVWDTATGVLRLTLEGHQKGVTDVAFNPAGDRLAAAGSDEAVRVWDTATGEHLLTLLGAAGQFARLAFSPDGRLLVRACKGSSHTGISAGVVETFTKIPGEIQVWDAVTGGKRASVDVSGWISAIAFSRDGRLLAVAEDDAVKLFDAQSWQLIDTLRGEAGTINGLAFGRGDERLAAAAERSVKVWDLVSGREAITFDGAAKSVAFDADGWLLATASGNDVRILDGSPYEPRPPVAAAEPKAPSRPPLEVSQPPTPVRDALDRATDYLQQGDLARALLWSVEALARDDDPHRAVAHRTRIALQLQNLPKLGDEAPQPPVTPAISRPAEGNCIWKLGPHAHRLAVMMYNVEATAEEKEQDERAGRTHVPYRWLLQLFDVRSGQPVGPQRRSTRMMRQEGVALSADGNRIALLQFRDDQKQDVCEIRLHDVQTGEPLGPTFDYSQRIGSPLELAISPNGRWVAAERDARVNRRHMLVWDGVSGQPLELDEPFNVVFFSPGGRWLLSGWNQRAGNRLNTVTQVWDARTLERTGRHLDVELIDNACFSADGQTVAVADGFRVKVFDVQTGLRRGAALDIGGSNFNMALGPRGTSAGHRERHVPAAVGRRRLAAHRPQGDFASELHGSPVHPDGAFVVAACGRSQRGSAQVFDAESGVSIGPTRGASFRLSRDGKDAVHVSRRGWEGE